MCGLGGKGRVICLIPQLEVLTYPWSPISSKLPNFDAVSAHDVLDFNDFMRGEAWAMTKAAKKKAKKDKKHAKAAQKKAKKEKRRQEKEAARAATEAKQKELRKQSAARAKQRREQLKRQAVSEAKARASNDDCRLTDLLIAFRNP